MLCSSLFRGSKLLFSTMQSTRGGAVSARDAIHAYNRVSRITIQRWPLFAVNIHMDLHSNAQGTGLHQYTAGLLCHVAKGGDNRRTSRTCQPLLAAEGCVSVAFHLFLTGFTSASSMLNFRIICMLRTDAVLGSLVKCWTSH